MGVFGVIRSMSAAVPPHVNTTFFARSMQRQTSPSKRYYFASLQRKTHMRFPPPCRLLIDIAGPAVNAIQDATKYTCPMLELIGFLPRFAVLSIARGRQATTLLSHEIYFTLSLASQLVLLPLRLELRLEFGVCSLTIVWNNRPKLPSAVISFVNSKLCSAALRHVQWLKDTLTQS